MVRHTGTMKAPLCIVLAALTLTGCVTYHTRSDGIARAGIGETAVADGPKVTPLALLEDSRCPMNTQCVWAGQLRISARIDLAKGSEMRELTLGKSEQVADGQLTMVEALPERTGEVTLYPEDYRFGFRFAGGL